jgi:hypothetical protein
MYFWQNPPFITRPGDIYNGLFMNVTGKKHFSASVISDCGAASLRDMYISQLETHLGEHRVHRYGKCGTLQTPRPPIENMLVKLAEYKL